MDHSEHSVQVVATENGVADLRGKAGAVQRRAVSAQAHVGIDTALLLR